jgi:hypothetical protein
MDTADGGNMADAMSGTGGGYMAFLDYMGDRGLSSKENAQRVKQASREVLLVVEGDDWEAKDVRELDLDDVAKRFEVLRATKYAPASLGAYRSRFRNGVTMYREFLQDPGGWRPSRTSRPTTTPRRKATVPAAAPAEQKTVEVPAQPSVETHDRSDTEMMTYPFPLRRDGGVVFARLILPHDLTPAEAKRIGDHINTLAIDEQRALPHPPHPENAG